MKKPLAIVVGGLITALMLSGIVWAKVSKPDILDIPVAWLGLSVLPLLVALVIGGYIKTFRGFGVEVEAQLVQPVSRALGSAKEYDAFREVTGARAEDVANAEAVFAKQSVAKLEDITDEDRLQFERLSFVNGRDVYKTWAIERHLELLPNIRFFEVDNHKGAFLGLLRREAVVSAGLDRFADALAQQEVDKVFGASFVTKSVAPDASLRSVAKRMARMKTDFIPVVARGELTGAIEKAELERRVGGAILSEL